MTSDTEHGRSPDGSGSRPTDGAQEVSTVPASIPNAEWIDHSEGGGCPLHANTMVRVQFRDGMVSEIARASLWWMSADKGRSQWIHRGRPSDITAYWIADPDLRASAIEARRAATAQTGAVHESATAESGDAQPQSPNDSGLSHTGVDRG